MCAYDGSGYRGWQSQAGGGTVQDALESVFASIVKQPLRVVASGRTDAGVHALAQSFHADVPDSCRMDPEAWVRALNARLPGDIRITSARVVEGDFHARFSAKGKIYEYLICRSAVLSPFLRNRVWHLPYSLNAAAFSDALEVYEGNHDFRRFAARRGNEPLLPPDDFYRRTIFSVELREEEEMLRLRFYGDGFMYRMVRMLVGTACQVAQGRMARAELQGMLLKKDGNKTRFCAPAGGLYLKEVVY